MPADLSDLFALLGRDNLLNEEHFGIKGFMLTAGVPYRDVLSVRGLWAPPYASSDFQLELRLHGEKVPTSDYRWNGNQCRRAGRLGELRVESLVVAAMARRVGLLELAVTNEGSATARVPLQMAIRGAADQVSFWEFAGPGCSETGLPWADRASAWVADPGPPNAVVKRKEAGAVAVCTDLTMTRWETLCGHWEGVLELAPGEARVIHVGFALGPSESTLAECRELVVAGHGAVAAACDDWSSAVAALFARVPRLAAADPRLTRFYNRSLVGLLLNQWRVPEFVVDPYFSTGGMLGGCVCCYLWDYGEPWEILPLYDPEALKAHIRQFLAVDITQHFAWVPTTGEAFGPWYPVNQEKIIHLIYYYVVFTGDTAFLDETVAERSVLDWVLHHAAWRDDLELPVSLIDYGKGNNHLELRGTYRYDHYLPDLNARRYANCLLAHELAKLRGRSAEPLVQRAEALKRLIKHFMWSREERWFRHLDEELRPDLRWTVQIFKPIGSAVLDEEELDGLVSHLNEEEFLSEWGLHSLSKLDPAYDQVDIDNGGGGNYTAFTPQIAERLYRAGRPEPAEDLLRRILWWGDRLPYWGDSIVANQMDYRKDTPLQNTIGAVAGAQAVIFGMLGVQVSPDGAITVDPHPPSFSPELRLTGLRLRGRVIDIAVSGGEYTVTADTRSITSPLGTPVVLPTKAR